MVFEQIEKLKREFTDQYVVINSQRPELARFANVTGRVKTVNMSGRALVEFDDYHLNIGWYDIDTDYLKIVDKPAPKLAETKHAAKPAAAAKAPAAPAAKDQPAGEKKLSPLEMARQQGAAKKEAPPAPAAGKEKKLSVQEMLAAARSEKQAGAAPTAAATPVKEPPATAPAKPAEAKPKMDRAKMSVADMLAAARAEKGGASKTPTARQEPASQPAVVEEPAAEEPEIEDSVNETAEDFDAPSAGTASPTSAATRVDRSKMTVADMIAWCRAHDTK